MEQNLGPEEWRPRVGMAIVASVGALFAPRALRGLLYAVAGGLLATVATGYCPINAIKKGTEAEAAEWRTLRTWRVEA
jgi:Protein of unknown function (DUF2892)